MQADAIPVNQTIWNNNKNCAGLLCENLLQNCLEYMVHPLMYAYMLLNLCLCKNLMSNWLVNPGAFSQGACMPILFLSTKQCETATWPLLLAPCENFDIMHLLGKSFPDTYMRYIYSTPANPTIWNSNRNLLRSWVVAQQASHAPRRAPPQGTSLSRIPVQKRTPVLVKHKHNKTIIEHLVIISIH
jgi:hypothetical protein